MMAPLAAPSQRSRHLAFTRQPDGKRNDDAAYLRTGLKQVTNGRFQKGQSGNPGGRPKIPPEVRQALQARAPEALEVLYAQLRHEDPRIAQAAAIAILDRAYGKPVQQIDQNNTFRKASELTNDELAAIAAGGSPDSPAAPDDEPA